MRTRHRRRFHTTRIVQNRRARYLRENRWGWPEDWLVKKLAYGRLASTDPWDCGRSQCGVCHLRDFGRRTREKREWRKEWEQ